MILFLMRELLNGQLRLRLNSNSFYAHAWSLMKPLRHDRRNKTNVITNIYIFFENNRQDLMTLLSILGNKSMLKWIYLNDVINYIRGLDYRAYFGYWSWPSKQFLSLAPIMFDIYLNFYFCCCLSKYISELSKTYFCEK